MKQTEWPVKAIATLAVWAVSQAAQPQSDFVPMPGFIGGDATYGLGLSRDGQTAVGAATRIIQGFMQPRAVTWSMSDGITDLGATPGTISRSVAYGVTDNLEFACGSSAGGYQYAVRFEADQVTKILPSFGVQSFEALDLSADGQTVVGYQGTTQGAHTAFRWTPASGTETLLPLSGIPFDKAYHVSADGLVAVGESRRLVGQLRLKTAVWWDVNGHVHQIGGPNGGDVNSVAMDCDSSGRFIYCHGTDVLTGDSVVYVFDRLFETKRVLTAPMGWETVTVRGCSQDGQFCVGTYASIDAFGTFIYGPGIGMEDIRDLIVRLGAIKCASWTLDWALDVAEHGSTLRVVGHGLDGLNQRRGYLASVPIGHYLWTHSRG